MMRRVFKVKLHPLRLVVSIVVLFVFTLPAFYLKSVIGWLPASTLVFASLLSFIYVRLLSRGIAFNEESFVSGCSRGENIELCVTVKNASRILSPHTEAVLYVSDAFDKVTSEETVGFALCPGEEKRISFTTRFEHVGEYAVGIRQIRINSFFGVLSLSLINMDSYRIMVSPRIHKLGRFYLQDRNNSENLRAYARSAAESVDHAGVREYEFGDPIKLIHWKLSSHVGGYMTKLLESYGNNGITIIPCLHSPVYPSETLMCIYDAIVEICFSLCNYSKENGLDVELLFIGRDGHRRSLDTSDIEAFTAVIHAMPMLHTEYAPQCDSIESLCEKGTACLYSNIALCVAAIDDALIHMLFRLRQERKNPLLFFMLPSSVYGDERRLALKPLNLLENVDIPYYVISSADEIGKEAG